MVVTSCSTSASAGVAAYLIEGPGSQLVDVEFESRIDTFGDL